MNWISKVSFYLRSLFSRRKLDAQMREEMRLHLEMETEAKRAVGMSPEDAGYAAEKEFGNVASVQERTREERGWVWLEQLFKDVGFTLRSAVRARGFTFTAVCTLAVGIGLATLVFDLSWRVLFDPLPYPDSGRLYEIGYKDKQGTFNVWRSGLYFQAYQEQTNVCSEYAAVKREASNVVIENEPVFADVRRTSADCFHVLGVVPRLGRGFIAEEFHEGSDNVVVVSDLFWRRRFRADPAVLGQTVKIDEVICTVVGVLAAEQSWPAAFAGDVYRPLVLRRGHGDLKADPRGVFDPMLAVIGRLRPGVTPAQAQTSLSAVKLGGLPGWAAAYFSGHETALTPLTGSRRVEVYWVMIIAAIFLYAIACLNTMNLSLVRLLARRRELAIRLAVGGSRWQVVRLLVIESVGLAVSAGVIAVLAARWLFPVIFALINRDDAYRYHTYLDGETLLCILGLTALACFTTLVVPVARFLGSPRTISLKESGAVKGESRRLGKTRNLLVALQAAFAVILLTGTGLMVRSFEKLHQVDLGFAPAGKVKVQILFSAGHAPAGLNARLELFGRLQRKLLFLPGVEAGSYGGDALLTGAFMGTAQLKMADGTFEPVAGSYVADDFSDAAGLTIIKGRWLSGSGSAKQVVINETLAKRRFGNLDPLGQMISIQVDPTPLEVVGVVKDVRDMVRSSAGMHIYFPNRISYPLNINTFVLRFAEDPVRGYEEVIRKAIYDFDPSLVAVTIVPMVDLVGNTMAAERYAFVVLRGLTAVALILAMIGLFAVITFSVKARMQEFGVRTALGAVPSDLSRLVLKRGFSTVAVGLGVGIVAALGLTRFMQSLLFETTPYEPMVYIAVAAVLLLVALLACWLPARRAARVDPVIALRSE